MSRINIQGTIDNIRSKSNIYTPIIEAIVNSMHNPLICTHGFRRYAPIFIDCTFCLA